MDALLIREPWISRILSGRKTWEMRSTGCRKRGRVALVRAGSGLVVGVADLVDSLAPLDTFEAYAAGEPFHAIGPVEQKAAYDGGWRTPWVLAGARALHSPVPYKHPSGAVTWVVLDPRVVEAVENQAGSDSIRDLSAPVTSFAGLRKETPIEGREAVRSDNCIASAGSRVVQLTGGNIRNGHIYMPMEFFPADAVGGANKQEAAPRSLRVSFVPGKTTETDIDGTKRILRVRGAVRDFLVRAELQEGDAVLIENTGPYTYRFSKA